MKKFIAVILSVLMLACLVPAAFAADAGSDAAFGSYKHVYILGFDGAGAAFSWNDTPNFDRIFTADNAYIYDGVGEDVTVSAQNWGAILTGVAWDVHGFTNGWAEENERGSDEGVNTIFYYVRQAKPDAELVSFNNWSAINHGIIENDLFVRKINRGTDELVCDAICQYIDAGNKPDLMFVQFDSVDHAGHAYGGQTDQYNSAVEKADVWLGMVYDHMAKAGALEDALFIVVADHGEANGGGHGGSSKEERSTFVAVAGKNVNAGELPAGTRNRDVAAIALYALGVEQPDHMTAKVPEGLFGEEREKTIEENGENSWIKRIRGILYAFVRMVNLLVGVFDGSIAYGF